VLEESTGLGRAFVGAGPRPALGTPKIERSWWLARHGVVQLGPKGCVRGECSSLVGAPFWSNGGH